MCGCNDVVMGVDGCVRVWVFSFLRCRVLGLFSPCIVVFTVGVWRLEYYGRLAGFFRSARSCGYVTRERDG